MRAMAPVIATVDHQPRWQNVYRTFDVYLSTFAAGHRITFADVMPAQSFDRSFDSQ
jgi:pterin-4a-carbinolamine dehydratase